MAAESSRRIDVPWLEPVVLLGATRRAHGLSDEARARMKPWLLAARARFRVARELRDAATQIVALSLLSEAAFFALCGLESVDAAESPATTPKEAWARFDARAEKPSGAPEELSLVREAFSADGALALDLIDPASANTLRLAAETTVAWLLGLVEIRTPREISRARLLRIALAVVGFAVIVWGLVAYWVSLRATELH
jgi:hypothetical protein